MQRYTHLQMSLIKRLKNSRSSVREAERSKRK